MLDPGIWSRNSYALRVLTVQGGKQMCKPSLEPIQDGIDSVDIIKPQREEFNPGMDWK